MSTVHTLTVFIEKPLTATEKANVLGANFSIAGHMWFRIEQYKDGVPVPDTQKDAGYTGHGVTREDNKDYVGSPAYTSRTVQISAEAYAKLKVFGDPTQGEAARLGFGPNDYNAVTNSCVDYVYKGLELADLNPRKIQGDLSPMKNLGFLEATLPPRIDPVVASQASTAPSLDPAAALTVPSDAPVRMSNNYITSSATDTHAVVIGKAGTVWDAYKTQVGSANGFSDWNEFKAAVAASNPNIADLNQVSAGATLYLPQKMSDGSVTYHYENGASVNNNTATGAYYMVVPNPEGGQSIYSRQVSAVTQDSNGVSVPSYTIQQISSDAEGRIIFSFSGEQTGLDGDIVSVQLSTTANDPSTARNDLLGAQLDLAAQGAQAVMAAHGGPLSGTQLLSTLVGMGLPGAEGLPQKPHSLEPSAADAAVPGNPNTLDAAAPASAAAKPSDATALLADNMHAPYREVDLAPAPICLPPASEAAPPLLWTLALDPSLLNTQADILVSALAGLAPPASSVSAAPIPMPSNLQSSSPSLYTPPVVLAASVL